MRSNRYYIFALWIAVIALTGCSAYANQGPARSMSDGTDAVMEWAFTQEKQHPEKMLIELIESAESTLDIAIYSLTHPDIVQSIKDARKRGVEVRIITDRIQAGGKSQTEALKILGSAGIPLKVNSHSGLMHHKMTIVDRKAATTGSYNYSKAASTRNDEVLMVIRDTTIAESFSEQFDSMWSNEDKFETIDRRIAHPADSNDAVGKGSDREERAEDQDSKPEESGQGTERREEAAKAGSRQGEASSSRTEPEDSSVSSAKATCSNPQIKGNIGSQDKIYHLPGGQYYERTEAEEWFCTSEEAVEAGYRAAVR